MNGSQAMVPSPSSTTPLPHSSVVASRTEPIQQAYGCAVMSAPSPSTPSDASSRPCPPLAVPTASPHRLPVHSGGEVGQHLVEQRTTVAPLEESAGLRRSVHCNAVTSADEVAPADEDSLTKAMTAATKKNLDAPVVPKMVDSAMSNSWSTPYGDAPIGTPIIPVNSIVRLPNDRFTSNLSNLGVSLGNGVDKVVVSINTIKHMEIDRFRVAPNLNKNNASFTSVQNPFESDDEEAAPDGALPAHLVKDVSEVDLDDAELSIKICDLIATPQKSKLASKKKSKSNKNKMVSQ